MDGISLLVGIGFGCVLGGAAGFIIANLAARSRSAVALAAGEAARAELGELRLHAQEP